MFSYSPIIMNILYIHVFANKYIFIFRLLTSVKLYKFCLYLSQVSQPLTSEHRTNIQIARIFS